MLALLHADTYKQMLWKPAVSRFCNDFKIRSTWALSVEQSPLSHLILNPSYWSLNTEALHTEALISYMTWWIISLAVKPLSGCSSVEIRLWVTYVVAIVAATHHKLVQQWLNHHLHKLPLLVPFPERQIETLLESRNQDENCILCFFLISTLHFKLSAHYLF